MESTDKGEMLSTYKKKDRSSSWIRDGEDELELSNSEFLSIDQDQEKLQELMKEKDKIIQERDQEKN